MSDGGAGAAGPRRAAAGLRAAEGPSGPRSAGQRLGGNLGAAAEGERRRGPASGRSEL